MSSRLWKPAPAPLEVVEACAPADDDINDIDQRLFFLLGNGSSPLALALSVESWLGLRSDGMAL
jgi:hypothetical protein